MSVVDDMEEQVRRIGPVGEMADLVHHEQAWMCVGSEGVGQSPGPESRGQLVDALGGGDEEGIETIPNGACLAATGPAREDQASSFDDEVSRERGAEQGIVKDDEKLRSQMASASP